MSYAIRVENLSKRYCISHHAFGRPTYRTLREDLMRWARAPFKSSVARNRSTKEYFWALKDVSFDVPPGEVLGIIGRNGAGKSTLLKILSRITEPTSGRVRVRGRVGSLLEVGTGFHPELTGRDNIFLSGAVLGMSRAEVLQKFAEIVAFAEVERFLDTPVKRYSSGMYMRLAFAVAAHLEPDILVVDEVLAVGDAAFQQKCLKRMDTVAARGRTIFFVSHNLGAVERLCHSVLLVEEGRIASHGRPSDVISNYLNSSGGTAIQWRRRLPSPDVPHFRTLRLCNADGSPCPQPTSASVLGVDIEFALPAPIKGLMLGVGVKTSVGDWIFSTSPADVQRRMPEQSGVYSTRLTFPGPIFCPRRFSLIFSLYDSFHAYDVLPDGLTFDVVETASLSNLLPNGRVGDLQMHCEWTPIIVAGAERETA